MFGITPAPPGARFHGSLPRLGAPVHIAEYADGVKICAYSEPADPAIGQDARRRYLPWQWGADKQQYVQRALPDQPRPLYRAENLELHPDWPLYVFEREDMVDAFHTLSGDAEVIATTVPGGCAAFVLGEWDGIGQRKVILWPTHAPECEQAMQELARRLDKQGATVLFLTVPQTQPALWTFLHVIEAQWTWAQCEAFVAANVQTLERQVKPITPARTHSPTAPTILEPKTVKPTDINFRDVWDRIPRLVRAANHTPHNNMANVCAVLESFNGKYGDVWYDEFHCKVLTDEQHPRAWRESDTLELTRVIQSEIGLTGVRPNTVFDAVNQVAYKRKRHEVREWLRSLKWDGEHRLALLLPSGWGTETTPYTTSVGRCFLVSAVARVMQPGCQVDYVPVFEGPGGRGKTSALRILGGQWFDNPSAQMGEKDFLQNMTGKWILELAELSNIRRHDLELIKAIITRTHDTYRSPYERAPADHHRQCVFAGTIDRGNWNTDEAGGRRWWPVSIGKIDLEWLASRREQLFAEALHRFDEHDSWHNVPLHDAAAAQVLRRPRDEWTRLIGEYLELITVDVPLAGVLKNALGLKPSEWTASNQSRARTILTDLKWIEDPRTQLWGRIARQ